MSALAEKRKQSLANLARKHDIPQCDSIEACNSSSEEDLLEYLSGEVHIDRWVAVTYNDSEGGFYYLKTFPTRERAEEYTIEHVSDDIFTESPIAVVDLDDPITAHGKIYRLLKLIPVYERE